MASQLLGIKTRFTNDLGSPLVGGQVYTYFAGTSTNQDSYSDAALTVPNTNPVILDDTGSADIFLKGAYRIRVFDKSGRFIEEQDNVTQAASQGDANGLRQQVDDLSNDVALQKLDTGITATAKFGGVARTQDEVNADRHHVKGFGVIGDGIADDTVALVKALTAGVPLDWGDVVCAHTGLDLTVDSIRWTSNGARLLYTGVYGECAAHIKVLKDSYVVGSFTSDGNNNTNLALRLSSAYEIASGVGRKPNLVTSGLCAVNVYRKNKLFKEGDGLYIGGSFHILHMEKTSIRDVIIATGADFGLLQGVSGVTIARFNNIFIDHVSITDVTVENVWSEDPTNYQDATGLRLFQDMTNENASMYVQDYKCINVANRAIKLHSSPNAIIDGVHRVLQASVIPQQGAFGNPDIDCQQAGATIKNCHFIYDGAWHETLVNNYSDYADDTRFRAGSTSGITAWIKNAAGNDIKVLSLTTPDGTVDAKYQANLSDVNIIGDIASVISMNLKNEVSSSINMSNIIASCTSEACRIVGSNAAKLTLLANNVVNTAATEVHFASKYSDTYDIETHGVRGFIKKRGYTQAGVKGLGVNGKPNATLDVFALGTGSQNVRLNGSTNLSAVDSNYTGWYEWYHQVNNKRLGLIGYADASSDLSIVNDLNGNINIRTQNFTQLTVSRFAVAFNVAKVSMVNLPTAATGLASGELWRDGTTLKIV